MKLTILAALFSALVAPAHASLIGETIQTQYLFPNTSTIFSGPISTVVAPGSELLNFASFATIEFSATNILIVLTRNAQLNNVAFDGLEFSDVNPAFQGVTLDPATNYAGFTSSRISSDAKTIFVNLEDLPGLTGQRISIDVGASAVPEPGYSFVLATVLFALLMAARSGAARARL